MSEKARKCMECGQAAVRRLACPGRTMPYRNMPAVEIPADFEMLTCAHCGALYIDEEAASALDEVLEQGYRIALRERVRKAIDVIARHVSQRRLEALLGISQGYLSRLKSGERDPSPELVSNLALLSRDPAVRIHELEEFWSTGPHFAARPRRRQGAS